MRCWCCEFLKCRQDVRGNSTSVALASTAQSSELAEVVLACRSSSKQLRCQNRVHNERQQKCLPWHLIKHRTMMLADEFVVSLILVHYYENFCANIYNNLLLLHIFAFFERVSWISLTGTKFSVLAFSLVVRVSFHLSFFFVVVRRSISLLA